MATIRQTHPFYSEGKVYSVIPKIEAIFIDLGNTMRILVKDEGYQSYARHKIVELLGSQESPETLCKRIDEGYKLYRK
jgi:hypothetical protein